MTRALLLDMDDTLYAERQFVRSGCCVVAAEVEARYGVPRRAALGTLIGAIRGGRRSRALQELCEAHQLPAGVVPQLVDTIRAHTPVLRLPDATAELLLAARAAGWTLGIVTNGFPSVQARKAAALGLPALVDAIIYANEWGTGAGKPERAPFRAALAALGVTAGEAVFVGDDLRCDVEGAQRAGLRTVWVCRAACQSGSAQSGSAQSRTGIPKSHVPLPDWALPDCSSPDRIVTGMDEVLSAAETLLATEVANAA